MQKVYKTDSAIKTQALGMEFATTLLPGSVVTLYGDLGAGKTTFVQGLAKGLGVKNRIISPTFVVVRSYRIENNELRIKNFYHIDLYRVEDENALNGIGMPEILADKDAVVVIEWAEKLGKLLPTKHTAITIGSPSEQRREIVIKNG